MLLDEIKGLVEPSARETHSLSPATESNGENELRWSSSSVVWSVGGVQKRKWSFTAHTQPVVAASFAWFNIRHARINMDPQGSGASRLQGTSLSSSTFGPFTLMRDAGLHSKSQADSKLNHSPALCICILHRDIGHIYSHDGLEFTIHLPFTVEKLWPLSPVGLILRVSGTSILPDQLASDSPSSTPRHYSLVTPFDEMRPVVERLMASDSSPQSSTCDLSPLASDERIIHVSRGLHDNAKSAPFLVVTVSTMRMRLRVLRYETQRNVGAHIRGGSAGVVEEKTNWEETAPSNETLTADSMTPDQFPPSTAKADLALQELWQGPLSEKDLQHVDSITLGIFNVFDDKYSVGIALQKDGPVVHVLQIVNNEPVHSASSVSRIPGTSVAGVLATRCREGLMDLLVLRTNGTLFLLTPSGSIEVTIEDVPSAIRVNQAFGQLVARASTVDVATGKFSRLPVQLTQAQGAFVTLTFSDGRSLRVCTDLSPQSSLVRSALVVMAQLCSPALFVNVRTRFMSLWAQRGSCGSDEEEFLCFSSAVIQLTDGSAAEGGVDNTLRGPWQQMKSHPMYRRTGSDRALQGLTLRSSSRLAAGVSQNHPELPVLLHALHLLGEELKIDGRKKQQLLILAPLLIRLGSSVGPDWVEHWLRTCPDAVSEWKLSTSAHLISPLSPPDLVGFLHTSLGVLTSSQVYIGPKVALEIYRTSPSFEYGSLDALRLTNGLLAAYGALKDAPDLSPATAKDRAHKAILMLMERGITLADIHCLPISVASPLLEALRTAQNSPPSDWPPDAYLLVGRNDLAKMALGDIEESLSFGEYFVPKSANLRQQQTYETIDVISEHSRMLSSVRLGAALETDPSRENFSAVRFAEDQRLGEMDLMMDSSRVPNVKIPERTDLNEHDLAKELGATVNHITERTFAQPFGRALYTFGSVTRLTRDEYYVPPIEMQVKFVPHNVTYPPDMTKIQPEAKHWAEFHNGVAASLRLNPNAEGIDSSWIAFNKPHELSAEHAGYLLGLGLTGHLRAIWSWHGYRYLVPKHEPTSIAILLGLGASRVGSGDADSTRLLTIHMRPLLPADSAELGIPLGAQSAALMGLGLLYLGTGNHTMAEVAMRELSVAHLTGGPEISNEHREAYTLTAGLSYGLIMCGLGSNLGRSSDANNVAILRAYVAGKEPPFHSSSSGLNSPVNLNYVSPAATIALALMFLKTNRADIASTFSLPPDPAGLKDVQPGLLLLRALGRSLVMWDDITPTVAWVLNQAQRTPKDLTKKQIQDGVKELYEFAFFNILSGACLAIGLKYAGTAATAANHVLLHFHDKLLENLRRQPPGQSFDIQLRRAAIREAINTVDLALALVMAGTGDVACLQRLRIRHGLFGPHIRYGAHMATHMALGFLFLGGGRYTLGTSNAAIACLVISLFPRFPLHSNDTRGLLQAFRHLWVLSVEPRCLIARDADTNEIARIPIKIKVDELAGEPVRTHHFICPTLLPDFGRFLSIKVDSPRYWPFVLNIAEDRRAREALLRTQTIYVKRRAGYLSYTDDPTGYQSISVWNGTPVGDPALLDFAASATPSERERHGAIDLPRSFHDMRHFSRSSINDGYLLAFADRLCRYPGKSAYEATALGYIQQALLEALSGDKQQILTTLLTVYQMCARSPRDIQWSGWNARDLHLTNEFYAMLFRFHGGLIENGQRQALLRIPALHSAVTMFSLAADSARHDPAFAHVFRLYARGEDLEEISNEATGLDWTRTLRFLAFVLQHERAPSGQTLAALRRLAESSVRPSAPSSESAGQGLITTNSESWRALRVALALVVQKTALSLSGPRTIPWSLRSVADFLEIWFSPNPPAGE